MNNLMNWELAFYVINLNMKNCSILNLLINRKFSKKKLKIALHIVLTNKNIGLIFKVIFKTLALF